MSNSQSETALYKSPSLSRNRDSLGDGSTNEVFEDNDSDIDINALKEDQTNTEKVLNFLLKYKCSENHTSYNFRSKNSKQKTKLPDTVKEHLKSIENINDLHGGVLLDYLIKICNFNKRILSTLETLNSKYENVITKRNEVPVNVTVTPPTPAAIIPGNPPSSRGEAPVSENIVFKVDQLEQKANNSVLICNGDFVTNLTGSNVPEIEIKNKVEIKVKSIFPELRPKDIVKVIPFGKDRKRIKIICNSTDIKNSIIYEARRKKLTDIFYSEYLTAHRFKLLYELRKIKRNNSSKIYAVYTRNGNLYYKLSSNDNHTIVKSMNDIEHLESVIQD